MEGQAALGAGGGEEPLGSGRMNVKRSGRAAEEESRNKPKLVSGLWGLEGGRGRCGDEEEVGGGGASDAVLSLPRVESERGAEGRAAGPGGAGLSRIKGCFGFFIFKASDGFWVLFGRGR